MKKRIVIQFCVTAKEKRRIAKQARDAQMSLSAYVRSVLWIKRASA